MLNDAVCFKAVYIVTGYTDLRSGMDRLAAVIESQTGDRLYVPDTLYLFCGRRADCIKGLVLGETAGFCCISGWRKADFSGRAIQKKYPC